MEREVDEGNGATLRKRGHACTPDARSVCEWLGLSKPTSALSLQPLSHTGEYPHSRMIGAMPADQTLVGSTNTKTPSEGEEEKVLREMKINALTDIKKPSPMCPQHVSEPQTCI